MTSNTETPAPGAVTEERRADLRRKSLKGAVIRFNKGYSAFECIVRNQSHGGARLSLGETFSLPRTFSLAIADDPARPAEVVWRTLSEVGIRFIDTDTRPLSRAA